MNLNKINKLLVANRGEIALRIINTAHKLNIPTLALVTEIEKNTLYGKLADETVVIGEGPSSSSFLNIEKIINVALQKNANAIHPGYGFLSENVKFVSEIEKNGLIFVGPNSKTMALMGAKDVSKKIMIEKNIPVTPGYNGESQDSSILESEADKIGYPVILKAVLGGGGKGMRIVRKKQEFQEMLQSCRAECRNAFNDDRIIIEKYIDDPKHIEVQILADNYGNTFHFFERDCSIQRRHQKIIEESPSNLPPEVIKKIRSVAVEAAKSVAYNNAGTIEFLVNKQTHDFYFMEMNTRLQVEHPVSEMVTGVDLMELQLRVAQGENLKDFKLPENPLGHAIEARICSEDCFQNFLPSMGKISYFEFNGKKIENWNNRRGNDIPKDVMKERLDSNMIIGDKITQYYDSMIGKLIVFGQNREQALKKLKKQIQDIKILGVQTNVPFILNLFEDQDFLDFNYSLKYFERKSETLLKERSSFDFVSIIQYILLKHYSRNGLQFFRNNSIVQKVFRLQTRRSFTNAEVQNFTVFLQQESPNSNVFKVRVNINDKQFEEVVVVSRNNDLSVELNGTIYYNQVLELGGAHYYHKNGAFYQIEDHTLKPLREDQEEELSNRMNSPMSGTVSKINFKEGDVVEEGAVLLCIEVMKIQNQITARKKLKIVKIFSEVSVFQEKDTPMMEVEYL